MKNLTLNDPTQTEILKHLQKTEDLLGKLATHLSGSPQTAEIFAMPDLGFPSNVQRIHGGFYTGAYYRWTTTVPFIPIDVTMNSCGISLYKLKKPIENEEEFLSAIHKTIDIVPKTSYLWNFNKGNHFITYGEVTGSSVVPDGFYLLQHSSASEFKKQYNGLYPEPDNWFSEDVKIFNDPESETSNRYIRYISGKKAELFTEQAKMLEIFNKTRHTFFAQQTIGSENIEKEILNVQHYGMPTSNSVAIGCQWNAKDFYVLLTAPDKPVFFIKPTLSGENSILVDSEKILLTPHGLGMKSVESPTITYSPDTLNINGKNFTMKDALKGKQEMELRSFDESKNVPDIVSHILEKCPGEIVGRFKQIYSYYNKQQ